METKITDKIKSFEDAMAATGRPALPAFADVPEDMREYFQSHYKMAVITKALNEGWEADWNDNNQRKYYPWFNNLGASAGFVFYGTDYCCSLADAGYASRFCFKTDALAEYAGCQFIDIWNVILMK